MNSIIKKLIDILPHKFPGKRYAIRSFLYLDGDLESMYLDNFSTFSREMQNDLLLPEIKEKIGIGQSYASTLDYLNKRTKVEDYHKSWII